MASSQLLVADEKAHLAVVMQPKQAAGDLMSGAVFQPHIDTLGPRLRLREINMKRVVIAVLRCQSELLMFGAATGNYVPQKIWFQ